MYKVVTTSLRICVRILWVAASPDGLVKDPFRPPDRHRVLLEIKCPYSARMLKLSAACTELNRSCYALVSGTAALKKNHDCQLSDSKSTIYYWKTLV